MLVIEFHSRAAVEIARAGDVDAARRNQLGRGREIQRRDGLLRPDAAAAHHLAFQRVGTLQQPRRQRDVARRESARESPLLLTTRPRHVTAGTTSVSKPELPPNSASTSTLPACRWPKRKLSPTSTARAPSRSTSSCAHELLGRELRQFRRERQNQHLLDAFLPHQLGAPFGRRHQRAARAPAPRRASGCGSNVSTEASSRARRASSLHAPQNPPVAEVHAIEIADGERARTEIRRRLVEAAIDLHAHLRVPGRRTPGGCAAAAGSRRARAPGRGRCG